MNPGTSPLIRVDASALAWEERLSQLEGDACAGASQCLTLLDVAAMRARREQSLAWASMAVRAAALLAACDGSRYRHVAELDAMTLRVEFIARQGACAGDPVLDVDTVVHWFLRSAAVSAEVTRAKASQPAAELSDGDLSQLRQWKSRLSLLKQLAGCGALAGRPELQAWLELDDLLP